MNTKQQKKFPSVIRLMDAFRTLQKAEAAHKIMCGSRDYVLSVSPAALKENQQHETEFRFVPLDLHHLQLLALNELGEFHGVEHMTRRYSRENLKPERALYLNAGDPYIPTVIYWRDRFTSKSVGDFIETWDNQGILFV